jgi:hypothetical protein
MAQMVASSAVEPTLPLSPLHRFGLWMADMLNHAFGNPGEEAVHRPPPIGVQPYSEGRPRRRRRFSY